MLFKSLDNTVDISSLISYCKYHRHSSRTGIPNVLAIFSLPFLPRVAAALAVRALLGLYCWGELSVEAASSRLGASSGAAATLRMLQVRHLGRTPGAVAAASNPWRLQARDVVRAPGTAAT